MPNLVDLANDMDALVTKLGLFANQASEDVASTILNDLVQVTPADTGEALSNWIVTLDAPALGGLIFSPFVPSPKGRMKSGVWVHAVDPSITARANIPQTLEAGMSVIQTKQPGQSIFITNNAPQIEILNQGSSKQAPAGFVERAIILGEQVVKNAKLP
jgi:hypothetical protein